MPLESKSSSDRTTNLRVLNGTGDSKFTWDHSKAEDREAARQTIADLKSKGYSFFRVDAEPADEVTAGAGELIVKKLSADEVLPKDPVSPETDGSDAVISETPKGRGRPKKTENIIAVRPVAGG